jgi:hypothetical protein
MRNKIFMIISFLATTLLLSSCLKDNFGEDWTADLKGKMYAETKQTGLVSYYVKKTPGDHIIKFQVNIATDVPPAFDITATVALDDAARIAYNTQFKATYVLYPTASNTGFQIVNPNVTIKAGTQAVWVSVRVWGTDVIGVSSTRVIPISITSVSNDIPIALNNKSILMRIRITN